MTEDWRKRRARDESQYHTEVEVRQTHPYDEATGVRLAAQHVSIMMEIAEIIEGRAVALMRQRALFEELPMHCSIAMFLTEEQNAKISAAWDCILGTSGMDDDDDPEEE